MFASRRRLILPEDRGPLRVMFVITVMPVGGAETLLAEIVRRMDRERFAPELCCLKWFGPMGQVLAREISAFAGLLTHKYDLAVLPRLRRLLRERQIDAVVTVGTGGDKMFWGRLAAWLERVPVICSALHSTGLPDRVEWPNRLLAPLTDAFIAVAETHGRYLAEHEGCPAARVRVIPNGVDVDRFRPRPSDPALRAGLGLAPVAPTVAIVAALRPEKHHELFLEAAARIRQRLPAARFLIVGDGPRRKPLERLAVERGLGEAACFLGARSDVPELLAASDVVLLTSHMEANPVSILEAMAAGRPVVASRVGSVAETVIEGETGYLVPRGAADALAERTLALLDDASLRERFGQAARESVVARWSVERMVTGYEDLIAGIYRSKCPNVGGRHGQRGVGRAAVPEPVVSPAGDSR